MLFYLVSERKPPPTRLAVEELVTRVQAFVPVQVGFAEETFLTLVAGEAHPLVGEYVLFQRPQVQEGLPAPVAAVVPLAPVTELVPVQILEQRERLPALVAPVVSFARVEELVHVQRAPLMKQRPAQVARVRPLSSVDPHVDFEIVFRGELLPTLVTAEQVLPGVDSLMPT